MCVTGRGEAGGERYDRAREGKRGDAALMWGDRASQGSICF